MSYLPDILDTYQVINDRMIITPWHLSPPKNIGTDDHSSVLTPEEFMAYCDKYITFIVKNRIKTCVFLVGSPGNPAYGYCNPNYMAPDKTIYPGRGLTADTDWGRKAGYLWFHYWENDSLDIEYKLIQVVNQPTNTSSLVQLLALTNSYAKKINNLHTTLGSFHSSLPKNFIPLQAPRSATYTPNTGPIGGSLTITYATGSVADLQTDGVVIIKSAYATSPIGIMKALAGHIQYGWSVGFYQSGTDLADYISCEITEITEKTITVDSGSARFTGTGLSGGLTNWSQIDSTTNNNLILVAPIFEPNAWRYVPALTNANTRVIESSPGNPKSGANYQHTLKILPDSYLNTLIEYKAPSDNSKEFPTLKKDMIRYRWTCRSQNNFNYFVPWVSTFLFERLPPEVKIGINITLDPKYAWGQYSKYTNPADTLNALADLLKTSYTKSRSVGQGISTKQGDVGLTDKQLYFLIMDHCSNEILLDESGEPISANALTDASSISIVDQRWYIDTNKGGEALFRLPYGDPNGFPIKFIGESLNYSNNIQRGDGLTAVDCKEDGKSYMPSKIDVLPCVPINTKTNPTAGPVVNEYAQKSVMGTVASTTVSSYNEKARYFPQNYPPFSYKSYFEDHDITVQRTYYPKDNLRQAFELVAYINSVSSRSIAEIAIDKEDMGNYNGSSKNPYPWPPVGNDVHNLIPIGENPNGVLKITLAGLKVDMKGWSNNLQGGYIGYGGKPGLLIGKGYMKWLFDMYMPQSLRVNNPCHTLPDPSGSDPPDGIGEMTYPNWGNSGKYGIGYINYNVGSFDLNADHIGTDQYVGYDIFDETNDINKQGSMWPQNDSQGGGLPYMYNKESDLNKSLSVGSKTHSWPTEFQVPATMLSYLDVSPFPEIYFGSLNNPIQIKASDAGLSPSDSFPLSQQYDSGIYQPSGFIIAYSELYWIGELKRLPISYAPNPTTIQKTLTNVYDYTGSGHNAPSSYFGGCGCGFDIVDPLPKGDLPCQFGATAQNKKTEAMSAYCQNKINSIKFNYPCQLGDKKSLLEPWQCTYTNCVDTGNGSTIYAHINPNDTKSDFKNKPTNFLNAIFNCYFDSNIGTLVSDPSSVYPAYGSNSYNLSSVNHCSYGDTNQVEQWPRALTGILTQGVKSEQIYYGNNSLPTFSFEYISRGNVDVDISKIPATSDTWNKDGTFNSTFIENITLYDRCDKDGNAHTFVDPYDQYMDILDGTSLILFVGSLGSDSITQRQIISQNSNYIRTEHSQITGDNHFISTLSAWSGGNLGFHPIGNITSKSLPQHLSLNTGDLFKRMTKVSGTFDGWGTWKWSSIIDMLNTMVNSYEVNRFSYYEIAFITMDHFINDVTDTNYIKPMYNFWGYDTNRGSKIYSTMTYPDKDGIKVFPVSGNVKGYGNMHTIVGPGQTIGVSWLINNTTAHAQPNMGYSMSQKIVYSPGVNGISQLSPLDYNLGNGFQLSGQNILETIDINNSTLYDPKVFHIDNDILSGSSDRIPVQNCIHDNTFPVFAWSSDSAPSIAIATNVRKTPAIAANVSGTGIPDKQISGIITDVVISDNRYLVSNLYNNETTNNIPGADIVVLVAEKTATRYNIWEIPYRQYNKDTMRSGSSSAELYEDHYSRIISVDIAGAGAYSLTIGVDGLIFWYQIHLDNNIVYIRLRCGGYLKGPIPISGFTGSWGVWGVNQTICQYTDTTANGKYYKSIFDLSNKDKIPMVLINTADSSNIKSEDFTEGAMVIKDNTFAEYYKIITIGQTSALDIGTTYLTMWETVVINDITVQELYTVNANEIFIPRMNQSSDWAQVQNSHTYYNISSSVMTALNYTLIGSEYKIYGVLYDLDTSAFKSISQTLCEFRFDANKKEKLNWYNHTNDPSIITWNKAQKRINKITIDSKNNLYVNGKGGADWSKTDEILSIFDCNNGPINGGSYGQSYKKITSNVPIGATNDLTKIELFDSFSGCTTNKNSLKNPTWNSNGQRLPNVAISDMKHQLLQTKDTSINSVTITKIPGSAPGSAYNSLYNSLVHIMPNSVVGKDNFTQGLNVIYSDGSNIKRHRLNSYRGTSDDKSIVFTDSDIDIDSKKITKCRLTNTFIINTSVNQNNSYNENNASYIMYYANNNSLLLVNQNSMATHIIPLTGTSNTPNAEYMEPAIIGSLNISNTGTTNYQSIETPITFDGSFKSIFAIGWNEKQSIDLDLPAGTITSNPMYVSNPMSIVRNQSKTGNTIKQITSMFTIINDSISNKLQLQLSTLELSRDITYNLKTICDITVLRNKKFDINIQKSGEFNEMYINFVPYYTRRRTDTSGYQQETVGKSYGYTLVSSIKGNLIMIQNNQDFLFGYTPFLSIFHKLDLPTDTSADYKLSMYKKYNNAPIALIDESFKSAAWSYSNPVIGFDCIYIIGKTKDVSVIWVIDMFTLSVRNCIQCKYTCDLAALKLDGYGRIHFISKNYYYCIDTEAFKPGNFSGQKQEYGKTRWNHSPNDYSKINTPKDWLYQNINIDDFFDESKGGGINRGGVVKMQNSSGSQNLSIKDQDVIINDNTYIYHIHIDTKKDSKRPCVDAVNNGNCFYYPFIGV